MLLVRPPRAMGVRRRWINWTKGYQRSSSVAYDIRGKVWGAGRRSKRAATKTRQKSYV